MGREAAFTIKQGLLKCDFEVVNCETLVSIRSVVKDNQKMWRLVEPSGLDTLNFLTYELLKVPQLNERLECMLFKANFPDDLQEVRKNVDLMLSVLRMLRSKQKLLSTFFLLALWLIRSCNGDTSKPKHGFQLKTLEKLAEKKCTKHADWTVFDFVLALMLPEDVNNFFSDEDITKLHNAKTITSHKVYEDGCDLVHKLHGVKLISDTGNYTEPSTKKIVKMERRRLTMPSRTPHAEAVVDDNDCFHQEMKKFVEENMPAARIIQKDCMKFMLLYKELAVFFEALNEVYPPPKPKDDSKYDLCDIFYSFAQNVRKHARNIEILRVFIRAHV